MQIKCSCGKALNVPDILAGKNVRCPGCNNVFKAPASGGEAPPPPPTKVMMECSCGKRLSAPVSAAGKKVHCPRCNKELVVPAPPAPEGAPAANAVAKPPSAAAKPAPAAAKPAPAPKPAAADLGSALTLEESHEPKKPPPAPAAQKPEEDYTISASKCPGCGATLALGAQFCVECGMNMATGGKVDGFKAGAAKKARKFSRKQIMVIVGAVAAIVVLGVLTLMMVKFFGKR